MSRDKANKYVRRAEMDPLGIDGLLKLDEPGKELFVDFAGDTLGYIDIRTGEFVKVQTFVSTMACTDYTFALCVPSQKTEDFLSALSELLANHNQTRMQQRPYTREEHFHAIEKPALRPLPDTTV